MDRHHEPDRAALRHRSRLDQDPRRPRDDGSYRHHRPEDLHLGRRARLAENIMHLVLARIDGAPAGVKGISLFVVPKFLLDDDGSRARATASPAARSSTRWASMATPPACIELRRRKGLAGRRGEPRPQRDVRDDERGAARRRRARAGHRRSRLSERRRSMRRTACKAARCPARRRPRSPPIPSSCIPTSARKLLEIRGVQRGARALRSAVALAIDRASHHPDEAARRTSNDCSRC